MHYAVALELLILGMKNILDLHVRANMKTVDIRRNKLILTPIWRSIEKGTLEIAQPIRQNRSAASPNFYLPIPDTTLFKKSVVLLWCNLMECTTCKCKTL